MADPILDRIARQIGAGDLATALAERLSGADLQSLLLAVYRRRAARRTPAAVLAQYARDRFTAPSAVSPRAFVEFDRRAFALAAPAYEALELAPVAPLGTCAALGPVDQNKVVTTIHNTEVLSDSTNALALEAALRRRAARARGAAAGPVRLCASHRLLRAQPFKAPARAHFRLFALCTAGRAAGVDGFELAALTEHLGFYLDLLDALAPLGYRLDQPRLAVTDLSGGPLGAAIAAQVFPALAARRPTATLEFDPDRTSGRGYYTRACFHVYARDRAGAEIELGDGGFTDWTARLLSDQRERLLISALASERICGGGFAAEC
jgi:hypothetical protein